MTRVAFINPGDGPPLFGEVEDALHVAKLLGGIPVFSVDLFEGEAHIGLFRPRNEENHTATRLLTLAGVQCSGPVIGLMIVTGKISGSITPIPPSLERFIELNTRVG
jgi:hypothetical protein